MALHVIYDIINIHVNQKQHFSTINYNQEDNTSEINLDHDLTEYEEIYVLITFIGIEWKGCKNLEE